MSDMRLIVAGAANRVAIKIVFDDIARRQATWREEARDVVMVGIDLAANRRVTLDIEDGKLSRQHAIGEDQLLEQRLFRMRRRLLRCRCLLPRARGRF